MTILKQIKEWANAFLEKIEKEEIREEELIKLIRIEEENQSSLLFYFLLEILLKVAYENKKIIISKGLLKYYLKSKFKESKDYLFYGEIKSCEVEELDNGLMLNKGLFIKIIDQLGLKESKMAYIKYLIAKDEEFRDMLNNEEKIKYGKLDAIIELLFEEIDSKEFNIMIYSFK